MESKEVLNWSVDVSEYIMTVFNKVSDTSSRKEKEEILSRVLESEEKETFIKVLVLAYDPRHDFYIKDLDSLPEAEKTEKKSILDFFELCNHLSTRFITGGEAKQALSDFLGNTDKNTKEIAELVISRDLRIGAGSKTLNKVFGDIIYEHPYMRCSLLDKKTIDRVEFPCISQTKLDGMYVDIVVTDAAVKYMSRSGQIMSKFNDTARDAALIRGASGYVLQGEVLVIGDDGATLPREEGNGYLNSDEVDPNKIFFGMWDCVSIEDFHAKSTKIEYQIRFEILNNIVNLLANSWIGVVETVICEDISEVIEHFKDNRSVGLEGTIVKNQKLPWKSHTSKDQLKLKVVAEGDLVITGWKEGKGKFEGMVGSITGQSSDGMVEVSVSGMTDKFRKQATENIDQWIEEERIITVKFNDIVDNELKPDLYALYLPRLVELRSDKEGRDSANSLERLREELNSFEFVV